MAKPWQEKVSMVMDNFGAGLAWASFWALFVKYMAIASQQYTHSPLSCLDIEVMTSMLPSRSRSSAGSLFLLDLRGVTFSCA